MNLNDYLLQRIVDRRNPQEIIEHIFYQNLWNIKKYKTRFHDGSLFVDNVKIAEIGFCDDEPEMKLIFVDWRIHGKAHRGEAFVYADKCDPSELVYPAGPLFAEMAGTLLVDHFKDVVRRRWEAKAELEKLYDDEPIGAKLRDGYRQSGIEAVKTS